jgi:adenosylcobinamide kinase / adenosylcobinamide-phosphate guanylyltransferase
MRVILSGSGPSSGFPVPGCPCATCALARRAGVVRAPAALTLPGGHLDADLHLAPVPGTAEDPGDEVTLRQLPGGALLTGTTGTVLWAPRPTVPDLVEHLRGIPLTVAYLGLPEHAAGNERTSSRQVLGGVIARLRAVGAVTDATEVAVVGLGHEGEQTTLPTVLEAWGAHRPADRSAPSGPRPRIAGRTLLLGGSGSGKSELAEDLMAAEPGVLYVATGPAPTPDDAEWTRRVERHRDRRPRWWATAECGPDTLPGLLRTETRPVLLDSVGSWLTAALDRTGAWDDRPGWREQLVTLTDALADAWRARRAPLVAVTEEVGWSVVAATAAGRRFTTELGRLNQRLAAQSESLLIVVAGRIVG